MCPEFVSGLRDRVRVMLLYIYANKDPSAIFSTQRKNIEDSVHWSVTGRPCLLEERAVERMLHQRPAAAGHAGCRIVDQPNPAAQLRVCRERRLLRKPGYDSTLCVWLRADVDVISLEDVSPSTFAHAKRAGSASWRLGCRLRLLDQPVDIPNSRGCLAMITFITGQTSVVEQREDAFAR